MLNFRPMLRFLKISNLAVIQGLEVEFDPGLNLLTGETGSGKSIIVDSVALLFGERAGAELIRGGEEKAYVEGVFRLEDGTGIGQSFQAAGVEPENEEIILRREVLATGKTRAFVNDRLVTVSFIRDLRPYLLDIHGQGESQTLLNPRSQLKALDAFAGTEELADEVRGLYEEHRGTKNSLDHLVRNESERLRMLDVLEFQIKEIEKVKPVPGEDETLGRERTILANAERILSLAQESYQTIYEGEDSIFSKERKVRKRLQQLSEFDVRAIPLDDQLERARVAFEEIAYFLRDYVEGIQFSPERLRELDERLVEIERLKRKYGPTIDDVLLAYEEMKLKLHEYSSGDEVRDELEARLLRIEEEYRRLAHQQSVRRRAAATDLERLITGEMQALAMEKARFGVRFDSFDQRIASEGMEAVEFIVAMNVGESLKPLSKVASGGEISRLMLAIRSIASRSTGPRTLVFDEIDVGVGGRAAESVGQRLKSLAETHQVFCVTHQPQIARFADAHFRVTKAVGAGRTHVSVERLNERGRVEELARMLGGAEITEITRRHARELLRTVTVVGS